MKFLTSIRRYGTVPCATGVCSAVMAFPAFASGAGSGGSGMSDILSGVTTLLTWILQSMTSVCTWILGNNLAFIYVGLFLVGGAMGFLFHVLRSV